MIATVFFAFMTSAALAGLVLYERYWLQGFLDNFTLLLTASLSAFAIFCLFSLYALHVRTSEHFRNIWLGLVSMALSYSAADLVGGLFFIPALSPSLVGDATVHHRLVADTHSALHSRDFNYIQRVNNLGLRGRDREERKIDGTLRIAMLGDSFTMGKGVKDDETFSVLLEKDLNLRSERPIEILNAGVDSYSPILSFLQLRNQLLNYEPDLVILNLDMSDLLQELAYRQRAVYDSSGALAGVDGRLDQLHLTRTQRARNWINEHLYFSRLLVYYLQRWSHQHTGISVASVVGMANPAILAHTLSKDDTTTRRGQWTPLFSSIRSIKSLCDERGISFLLTTYPWGHQVNESEWQPGRFAFVTPEDIPSDTSLEYIRVFAHDNEIDFLDFFGKFRAYSGREKLYYRYDMHWTPSGHKLVADTFAGYLRQHYPTLITEKRIP